MTDTKGEADLYSTSNHLESMPARDEFDVPSVGDLKSTLDAAEDPNNPQVDSPSSIRTRHNSLTSVELVFDSQALHIPNHLFLHIPRQYELQQLHRRNPGNHQRVQRHSNPSRILGLFQCISLRRREYLLGSADAGCRQTPSLPDLHALSLRD